jgi:hypothetical protein
MIILRERCEVDVYLNIFAYKNIKIIFYYYF